MARVNKTFLKAQQLAEAPVEGYFMGSRVHPILAMLPVGVLAFAALSQLIILQIIVTIVVFAGLMATLGRSVAVTADEIILLATRPPLWRPAKVAKRLPREPVTVEKTRLYWKVPIDGSTYWVNQSFTDYVNLISDAPLEGAASKRPSGKSSSVAKSASTTDGAVRERQIVESTRRVTPKGTRNRKEKKWR